MPTQIKAYCYFSIGFIGDGTNNSRQVNFKTAPFILGGAGGAGTALSLSNDFTLAGLLPIGASNVNSSDGQTCTVTVGLLGAVTFAWPNPPANGAQVLVYGFLEF